MGGMREHIHRLYGCHLIVCVQSLQVTSLRGRVTRHIDDTLWSCLQYGLYHVGVHTGTGWVGDDDIRTTMLRDKLICQDVLHVPCVEQGIVNMVLL